jgi:hypothetical protein
LLALALSSLMAAGTASADALRGTVTTPGGQPVAGVTVDCGATVGTTVTNATGQWSVQLPTGSDGLVYTVTPALAGWVFTPPTRQVTVASGEGVGNFTAQPTLTVSGYNKAPATINVGTYTSLLAVRLAATGGAATIRGLKVRDTGSAAAADLGVKIVKSGAEVPATITSDPGTKTWTVTFTKALTMAAGGYVYLDVQEQAGAGAAGKTVQAILVDATFVNTDSAVSGTLPLTSKAAAVFSLGKADVSGFSTAPATTTDNTFTSMLKMRVAAVGGTVPVLGLKVSDIGTAPGATLNLRILKGGFEVPSTSTYDWRTKTWVITFVNAVNVADGTYTYFELQESAGPDAMVGNLKLTVVDAASVLAGAEVGGLFPLTSNATSLRSTGTLALGGYSMAPTAVEQDAPTNMLKLRCDATGDAVAITHLKARDLGTAPAAALGLKVFVGSAELAGTMTYNDTSKAWTLALAKPYLVKAGTYAYFTFQETAGLAAVGSTVRLSVGGTGFVLANGTVTMAAALNTASVPVITSTAVEVSGASLAPPTFVPTLFTPMHRVSLRGRNGAVTVTGLKVRDVGTAAAADLGLQIWRGGVDITPAGMTFDAASKTWTATFDVPIDLAKDETTDLELREAAGPGSVASTMQLTVANTAAVLTANRVVGTLPQTSGGCLIKPSSTLTVSSTSVARPTMPIDTYNPMQRVKVVAGDGPLTITALRVTEVGSVGAGDGLGLQIWRGQINITPITPMVFDTGTKTWTVIFDSPIPLAANDTAEFELRELVGLAGLGKTAQLSLVDDQTIISSATVTNAPSDFPMISGASVVVLPTTLTVTGTDAAPARLVHDTTTTMLRLGLAAANGGVTITGLRVHDAGTAAASALALRVMRGTLDITPATTTFDGPSKTWTLTFTSPLTLSDGEQVTLDLQETPGAAAVGGTMQLQVTDVNAITANSLVVGTFPIQSGVTRVVLPTTMTVTSLDAAPQNIAVGFFLPMLRVSVLANNGPVVVTGLVVSDIGTATATALSIRVMRGAANITPANPIFDPVTRTWTLNFATPVTVNESTTTNFDLYESPAAAAVGGTMRLRLIDATTILTQTATPSVNSTFPLVSGTANAVPGTTLRLVGQHIAPSYGVVGGRDTRLLRITLTAEAGTVNLRRLRFRETGNLGVGGVYIKIFNGALDVTPTGVGIDYPNRLYQYTWATPIPIDPAVPLVLEIAERPPTDVVGSTVALSVIDATAVGSDAATVTATWPVASTPTAIVAAPDLDVTGTASGTTVRTTQYLSLLRLRFQANVLAATISGFQVRDLGNSTGTDLQLQYSATIDPSPLTKTYNPANRTFTFTFGTPVVLAAGATTDFNVMAQAVAGQAGRTVQLSLDNASFITADQTVVGTFPIQSGVATIQ